MNYTILKAIHLIAILAWSAGLFYIGRIFVYYVESNSSEVKSTLGTMAIRLSRFIMLPASIITLLVGLHMAGVIGAFAQGWFHIKLSLLILLFWVPTHGVKVCQTTGQRVIPKIIPLVQSI